RLSGGASHGYTDCTDKKRNIPRNPCNPWLAYNMPHRLNVSWGERHESCGSLCLVIFVAGVIVAAGFHPVERQTRLLQEGSRRPGGQHEGLRRPDGGSGVQLRRVGFPGV